MFLILKGAKSFEGQQTAAVSAGWLPQFGNPEFRIKNCSTGYNYPDHQFGGLERVNPVVCKIQLSGRHGVEIEQSAY
jgi:hypothetical protein